VSVVQQLHIPQQEHLFKATVEAAVLCHEYCCCSWGWYSKVLFLLECGTNSLVHNTHA
jgi:hypothetical protein